MSKPKKLKAGTKIQYKHGKGLSTGEVIEYTDDGKVRIKTKNGSETVRPADSVERA